MSRKRKAPKKIPIVDPKFKSAIIPKLINSIMYDGKKTTSEKIIYGALDKIKDKTKNSEQVKLAEANILRDLGDFDQAYSIISEQIRTSGETPERLGNLALVQQHRRSPDKAINLLKNALKIEPDNWVLRINLFHNLFLNGCFSEAWKEFEWRLEEPRLKLKLEKFLNEE